MHFKEYTDNKTLSKSRGRHPKHFFQYRIILWNTLYDIFIQLNRILHYTINKMGLHYPNKYTN